MAFLYRKLAYRPVLRARCSISRFNRSFSGLSSEINGSITKENRGRADEDFGIKYRNTEKLRLKLEQMKTLTQENREMSRELIDSTEDKHMILERLIDQEKHIGNVDTIEKLLFVLPPSVVVLNIFDYLKSRGFRIPDREKPYWPLITKATIELSKKIMRTDAERKFAVRAASTPILLTAQLFRLCINMRLGALACKIHSDMIWMTKNQDKAVSEEWQVLYNHRNIHDLVRMLSLRDPSRDEEDLARIFKAISICNECAPKMEPFSYTAMEIVAILDKAALFTKRNNFSASQVKLAETVISKMGVAMVDLIEKQVAGKHLGTNRIVCFQTLHHYLAFCYRYIEGRIFFNDGGSVYSTWCSIKPFHNIVYNTDIKTPNNNELNCYYYYGVLASMISFFSKNIRYRPMVSELIKQLPISSVNVAPGLMTSMVNYSIRVKNTRLMKFILSQYSDATLGLRTKYTASQMSSMLKLALASKEFARARKIMTFMKKNLMTCQPIEFNELIIATLQSSIKDKEQNAWEMIQQREAEVAKYGYISFLNYMINSNSGLDFDKTEYIFRRAVRSIDPNENHFWDYWHLSYMKYIDRKYDTWQCIQVYQNCIYTDNSPFKTLSDFEYRQNPFCTRLDKVRMSLSVSVRPLIIRDIFKVAFGKLSSQKSNDSEFRESRKEWKKVRRWCIEELKNLGISQESIWIDLQKSISKQTRNIGFNLEKALIDRRRDMQVTAKGPGKRLDRSIRTTYFGNLKQLKEVWRNSD